MVFQFCNQDCSIKIWWKERMNYWNNCAVYELQECYCYVWFHQLYSRYESNQMDMMETSYLISYKNDKVSKPASQF